MIISYGNKKKDDILAIVCGNYNRMFMKMKISVLYLNIAYFEYLNTLLDIKLIFLFKLNQKKFQMCKY